MAIRAPRIDLNARSDNASRSAPSNAARPDADPLEALKSIGGIDAVRILTIHKCKGLEFHTVIVTL